jgi:hypothetical protein
MTINKQKKALFINPSSATFDDDLPPPLLLVSVAGYFQGIVSKNDTHTISDLR